MALLHNLQRSWIVSLRRNAISLIFPLAAVGLIYSDYSHTQKCKARDKSLRKLQEKLEDVY